MGDPFIQHKDILKYADSTVNLHRESARKYRAQVNRLRDQLSNHIKDNPGFSLVKMLLSGSLAKGTALSDFNDIDVAVYVEVDEAPTDEKEMLKWFYERLREIYSNLSEDQFRIQEHTVRISFRGTGLDVEVVPIIYEGDENDKGYLISQQTGKRVLTSIPLHLKFIRSRKELQPIHYAQTIRLLKWWVREQKSLDTSFKFKSFMIEMICAHLIDTGLDFSNYPEALQRFFVYIIQDGFSSRIAFTDFYSSSELPASSTGKIEIFDPVNPENNIAEDYSSTDCERIIQAAQSAFDAISEAQWADTKGRSQEAWKRVLGASFRV